MLALSALGAGRLAAQISPGPLSRAHQSLEGARNCTQCHGNGGKDAMNGQCVNCHGEVGSKLLDQRGFHASAEVRGQRCASCHPDHAGVDFNLIKWPGAGRDQFPHQRTGWPLEQSHARVQCTACHTPKLQTGAELRLAPRGSTPHWIGLGTTCASCHEDIHRGALGTTCTKCHDVGKWTRTPGFNHDSTSYPLTDKHQAVACNKCHAAAGLSPRRDAAGKPIPIYQPVPHTTCSACHTDPHNGGLGTECASCHTTRGFKVIDKQRFDHQRTRYPLQGRHTAVACARCHGGFGTATEKKPAFATCQGCHRDAHQGTATLAGAKVDCASCHVVTGFTPASFTVAQHRQTAYPLDGKHATTRCDACHRKDATAAGLAKWGSARVVIRPVSTTCRSCHADDHGTQLASRPDGGACSACHTSAGWTPTTFGVAAHAKLKLPLTGKHASVSCKACHAADRPGLPPLTVTAALGKVKLRFTLTEVQCANCHQDVHRGRFATARDSVPPIGCQECHDAEAFRPSTLDVARHTLTGFALEGAHRATPCVVCHKTLATPHARTAALVRAPAVAAPALEAPTTCTACHETPHGDQFDGRPDGGRCAACHDAVAFAPAGRFDHTRDTKFTLKGAHERVPCASCHKIQPVAGQPARQQFRPLSTKCESCHAGKEGS